MAFKVSIVHLVPTHIHLHIPFRPSTEPRREQVLPNYLLERATHYPSELRVLVFIIKHIHFTSFIFNYPEILSEKTYSKHGFKKLHETLLNLRDELFPKSLSSHICTKMCCFLSCCISWNVPKLSWIIFTKSCLLHATIIYSPL